MPIVPERSCRETLRVSGQADRAVPSVRGRTPSCLPSRLFTHRVKHVQQHLHRLIRERGPVAVHEGLLELLHGDEARAVQVDRAEPLLQLLRVRGPVLGRVALSSLRRVSSLLAVLLLWSAVGLLRCIAALRRPAALPVWLLVLGRCATVSTTVALLLSAVRWTASGRVGRACR